MFLARPSLRILVENFHAGLNKVVSGAFRADSFGSQWHANVTMNGITLRVSEVAASDDVDGSAKVEDIVHPLADPEVVEL